MAGKLDGQSAIITGGGSGIGRETALRFLRDGASVVIGDLNEKRGHETIELAASEGFGDRIHFIRTDVSKEGEVEALVELTAREFGRLDCVFNNAGLMGALGKIDQIDVENWDFTFAVLVRGVFLGMKHAARVMKAQGQGGSIVNTGSIAALSGGRGPHAYSAAKAAVVNLTRATSVEPAKHRIRVNCVCPGGILTPLVHRGNEEALEEPMRQAQPLREVGRGQDVAAMVAYLASEESRFVTGATFVLDGGVTAAGPHIYHGQWEAITGASVDRGTTELRRVSGRPRRADPRFSG